MENIFETKEQSKKVSWKKVFSMIFLLLGSVIGAGYASGREITTFFKESGYFNIILFIIVLIGIASFLFSYARVGKLINAKDFKDLNKKVFKKRGKIFDFLIPLIIFSSMFVMTAGVDSLAHTMIDNYSFEYLGIIVSIFVIAVVSGGLRSVMRFSSIVVPIIIVLIIGVSGYYIYSGPELNVDFVVKDDLMSNISFLILTFAYIGGNVMTSGVLLSQHGRKLTRRESRIISVVFAIIFVLSLSLVTFSIFASNNVIFASDMPMVLLANGLSNFLGIIYSFILFVAIISTYVSCAFALNGEFKKYFNNNNFITVTIIVVSGYIISRIGFGSLMSIIYPIKGFLSFIYALFIFKFYLKNRRKLNYYKERKKLSKKYAV